MQLIMIATMTVDATSCFKPSTCFRMAGLDLALIESDRTCGPSDPQLVYVDDNEPGTVSLREALG